MQQVTGIRFKKAGKIYYFDPGEIELTPGDRAIVETARGIECGEVVVGPKTVPAEEIVQPLKSVMRKAESEDFARLEENRLKEARAFDIGLEKIAKHGLPMKLVDVEYTFDGSKIVFYFTAEGRVDFRDLVKDLASVFKTRIELRQIGVRDQAKMIGGLGPCGRGLCCSSFLGDFDPVSIKMAKEQNLSLNPTKISGICGRLMCCLRYESEQYKDVERRSPAEDPSEPTDEDDSDAVFAGKQIAEEQVVEAEDESPNREETSRRENGTQARNEASEGEAKTPKRSHKRRRRKRKAPGGFGAQDKQNDAKRTDAKRTDSGQPDDKRSDANHAAANAGSGKAAKDESDKRSQLSPASKKNSGTGSSRGRRWRKPGGNGSKGSGSKQYGGAGTKRQQSE